MDEKQMLLIAVAEAFEWLEAHVLAAPCDPEYARTIHYAGIDVLDILRGEWDRPDQESSWAAEADDQRPAE